MKEIIEKETVRRTALLQRAVEFMAPITQMVKSAKESGAIAGLHLYPPTSRDTTWVSGILLCRSFHLGVGRRRRRYLFWVSPEGTIEICLESGRDLSEEDADRYKDDEEIIWERTYYYKDSSPTITDLKMMIEEALITDAVEVRGKLGPRGV